MPIPRRLFELGIDEATESTMVAIHRFLSARKAYAFSKEELAEALTPACPSGALPAALAKLAELGAVEVRDVRGKRYFAYLRDLEDVA